MSHFANIDLIFLFFFLGAVAGWLKSDLQVPDQISKFLSIFLLLSLGLKGGHEVRVASDLTGFLPILIIGILSCLAIPFFSFFIHKKRLGPANSAALAACFGSVSAVTFIAAQGFLENEQIQSSGFMVAIMALMEIPAILVALFFYRRYQNNSGDRETAASIPSIYASKSVLLLLGGFVIGLLMNALSWDSIAPVAKDSFKGVLSYFLLDLGILAQKQLSQAWRHKGIALVIAVFQPLIFGSVAMFFASSIGVPQGDQILLAVLVGSASYIAAPAAIRASIPEANPSLYIALPLALTFPMNILIGIPFYFELSKIFT